MDKKEKTTHFGFKQVPEFLKENLVSDVFSSVANNYDLMNDVMSLGVHRIWKDEFIKYLQPKADETILDMGGGTGDIAFRILKTTGFLAKVDVADINEDMLNVGKERAINKGIVKNITWNVQNAEQLTFDDESYNAYTISFCIRNVTNIQNALNEAYRVLKTGGRFFCLEFSKLENDLLQGLYDKYTFNFLPFMGKIIAKDSQSYAYLAESIKQFPTQDDFQKLIQNAGFKNTGYQNLSNGICAIHWGMK